MQSKTQKNHPKKKNNYERIIECVITKVNDKNLEVLDVNTKTKHIINVYNITEFFVSSLNNHFKIGQKIFAYKMQNGVVSYKFIHPEEIKSKYKPISTKSSYKNLDRYVTKLIKEY